MRVLCKDCKYYVIEKPDWVEFSEEQKIQNQRYLCSHPEAVQPVNGAYLECLKIRDNEEECGITAKYFEKIE